MFIDGRTGDVVVVGLYGTMSFAVAQLTRELGIRIALGDRRA